jgi:hypothetical protein
MTWVRPAQRRSANRAGPCATGLSGAGKNWKRAALQLADGQRRNVVDCTAQQPSAGRGDMQVQIVGPSEPADALGQPLSTEASGRI